MSQTFLPTFVSFILFKTGEKEITWNGWIDSSIKYEKNVRSVIIRHFSHHKIENEKDRNFLLIISSDSFIVRARSTVVWLPQIQPMKIEWLLYVNNIKYFIFSFSNHFRIFSPISLHSFMRPTGMFSIQIDYYRLLRMCFELKSVSFSFSFFFVSASHLFCDLAAH